MQSQEGPSASSQETSVPRVLGPSLVGGRPDSPTPSPNPNPSALASEFLCPAFLLPLYVLKIASPFPLEHSGTYF